ALQTVRNSELVRGGTLGSIVKKPEEKRQLSEEREGREGKRKGKRGKKKKGGEEGREKGSGGPREIPGQ
ncbi:hypothetical protein ACC708_36015, partial [Rhizobium ruizarguesonis]